jgi:hypothetical protein
MLLHPKVSDIATVPRNNLRLRHIRGRPFFIGIAKEEFACLDERA